MNKIKAALTVMTVLLGLAASGPALAHGGGHVRFGVVIGGPFYPWYWYGYPYGYPYYYPPAYYPPSAPTTYIEQGGQAAPAQPQSQGYWYYCADAKSYYPYVKECPAGWQRVAPTPPPG